MKVQRPTMLPLVKSERRKASSSLQRPSPPAPCSWTPGLLGSEVHTDAIAASRLHLQYFIYHSRMEPAQVVCNTLRLRTQCFPKICRLTAVRTVAKLFLFLKAIWIFLLRVNCSLLRRDTIFVYIGKFNFFCNKARENGTSSHGSLGFHTHVLALLTEFLGQLRVRIKLWQVEKRGSSLSWEDYIALTRRDLVQGTYSQNLG